MTSLDRGNSQEIGENGEVDLKSATIESIQDKFRQKEILLEQRIVAVEK